MSNVEKAAIKKRSIKVAVSNDGQQNVKSNISHSVHILLTYSASPRILMYIKGALDVYLKEGFIRPFLVEKESKNDKRTFVEYPLTLKQASIEKECNGLKRGYFLITSKEYYGERVNIVAKLQDLVYQLTSFITDTIDIKCGGEWTDLDLKYEVHLQARAMSNMANACMRDKIVHMYASELLETWPTNSTVTKGHEHMATISVPCIDDVDSFMKYQQLKN